MITNFQNIKHKKINSVVCKSSLSKDLKYIYKKFKKDCVSWNYIIYINIQKELDEKLLINLIDKTVYNSYESGSYGEIIKKNFLINSKNNETIRNISLDRIESKPTITLIKLSKGAIADIDYIRRGLLVSENTYIECI